MATIDFKHGVYGQINAGGTGASERATGEQAFVYIGTAPVNQVEGGDAYVNKPVLVNNLAEARKYFGYSDNWANYTLCEAMYVHFQMNAVGPIVLINVLDPEAHKAEGDPFVMTTPINGRVTIPAAEDIILDSLSVVRGEIMLVKGTDWTAAYDYAKKAIIISEVSSGSLGTTELTVSYHAVNPALVTAADVIGSTDEYGLNKGIYAVKNVYALTGRIPAYLLAPGFASVPEIHVALAANSENISGHWNAWMFVDMPLIDAQGNSITLQTAATWKTNNGYNLDNESVYFPMIVGTDSRHYHLSVINAANMQALLIDNSGIPYMSGSNTEIGIAQNLYFGENLLGRVFDDELINRTLCKYGVNSAVYTGGRWVIWGMFPASFAYDSANDTNRFDTTRMMLYYLTNDFQHRRNAIVDKPMTANALKSIVAEEQTRLDALLGIGALTYGKAVLDASRIAKSDIYAGDFSIAFDVTTTPLAKSMTAIANWTDDGFVAYFDGRFWRPFIHDKGE